MCTEVPGYSKNKVGRSAFRCARKYFQYLLIFAETSALDLLIHILRSSFLFLRGSALCAGSISELDHSFEIDHHFLLTTRMRW